MEASAQADVISSFFSWSIGNFSTLPSDQKKSEAFEAGGCKWQVSIYPKGDSRVAGDHLSIFLEVAGVDNEPVGWSRLADVHWSVADQVCSKDTFKRHNGDSWFNATSTSWGFPSFMPLSQLHDSSKGFLLNDTLILNAWVTVAQATTPSPTFTWAIQNFSKLSTRITTTDFAIGDYGWFMEMENSPCGSQDNANYLKLFLWVANTDKDSLPRPRGWSRYVQYDYQ